MENIFYIVIIGATIGLLVTMTLTSPVVEDWAKNRRLKQISAEFEAARQAKSAKSNS